MAPQTAQTGDLTQNEGQATLDLGGLLAPVLQHGLGLYSFGLRSQIIRALYLEQPYIFRGVNASDGTNLPNAKSVLLFQVVEERARSQAA